MDMSHSVLVDESMFSVSDRWVSRTPANALHQKRSDWTVCSSRLINMQYKLRISREPNVKDISQTNGVKPRTLISPLSILERKQSNLRLVNDGNASMSHSLS